MRKSQIEKKVRDILSKDYDPLKTAVKYEIEYYEHNYSELKRVHRKNLEDLLRIFTERGAVTSEAAAEIRKRLRTMEQL